jgi:hypothetical protein
MLRMKLARIHGKTLGLETASLHRAGREPDSGQKVAQPCCGHHGEPLELRGNSSRGIDRAIEQVYVDD